MNNAAFPGTDGWFVVDRIDLDAEPQPGGQLFLAHQIGKHLTGLFTFRPEAIIGRRTDLNLSGVPDRVELEYWVSGHCVIVASTPNRIDPQMRDYALSIDGTAVPYLTTPWRPAAELIAEAAFLILRSLMHHPRHTSSARH